MTTSNNGQHKQVWVAAYMRRDDGCVLVRWRRQGDIDAGKLSPPGGKVEYGESPAAALKRELREETGCRLVREKLLATYDSPPGIIFFYRVLEWRGSIVNEEGQDAWVWMQPEAIVREPVQGSLARWLGMSPPRCLPVTEQ